MRNKTLWILFTTLYHLLSWGSILIYTIIKYGSFVKGNSILLVFAFVLALSVVLIMQSLKETAENGFGLFRKIARSVRKLIPMSILFAFIAIMNTNIGSIYDVMFWGLIANIVAQPIGVLAYWMGPQYVEDTSANKILKKLN